MRAEQFSGCNATLGSPSDDDGNPIHAVEPLPVIAGENGFVSQWRPSRVEASMIAQGAPIRLYVLGQSHPPVMLEVFDPRSGPDAE